VTQEQAPYEVTTTRILSVVIEEVKVKKEPATKITVKWEQLQPNRSWEGHSYWSCREPHPSFWDSLHEMLPHVREVMRLPDDYANLAVSKIVLTYDDDGCMTAKTTCVKNIKEGAGVIETPAIPEDGDEFVLMSEGYRDAVDKATIWAMQFVLIGQSVSV